MRHTIFTFILCLAGLSLIAQADVKNIDHKQIAAEYETENEGWLVLIDEAYEESKATGKPIMANFTGSDWCGWCKRLSASVFVKDQFKKWAKDNVVLLELDFPKRKKIPANLKQQNAQLQQAFKVSGFPTVWLFDLDKDAESGQFQISALGKTGYAKTVSDFTGAMDKMIARRKTETTPNSSGQ